MHIHEYGLVHGREHRGIVYRIDVIPDRQIPQYKLSFDNPNIRTLLFDKSSDTVNDIENEAREMIDEYLDKK